MGKPEKSASAQSEKITGIARNAEFLSSAFRRDSCTPFAASHFGETIRSSVASKIIAHSPRARAHSSAPNSGATLQPAHCQLPTHQLSSRALVRALIPARKPASDPLFRFTSPTERPSPASSFSCDNQSSTRYIPSMRGSVNFHPSPRTASNHKVIQNCLLFLALIASSAPNALAQQTTNKPHIPPWSVSRPPVPSQNPEITPGGTFSRPQSTFNPQTGSFSRPSSTFAHPASSYTPRPPIQLPPEHPDRPPRPHRPVTLYPQTVIIQNPVVYEPYYIPVETPIPAEAAPDTTPAQPATDVPPVVLDLPPGATIRKPATPAQPLSAAAAPAPATAAAPKPATTQAQPSASK